MGRMSDLDVLIEEAARNISGGDRTISRLLADAMRGALDGHFERDGKPKPPEYQEFVVLAMDYGTTSYHVHVLVQTVEQFNAMFRIGCKYRRMLMNSGAMDLPHMEQDLARELVEAGLTILVPRVIEVDTMWCDGGCEKPHYKKEGA